MDLFHFLPAKVLLSQLLVVPLVRKLQRMIILLDFDPFKEKFL